MQKFNFKKWMPYIAIIGIFLALATIYFSPVVFENKDLPQPDVINAKATGVDLKDYHTETGEDGYWTNTMFGGMPYNYSTTIPSYINIYIWLQKLVIIGPHSHFNVLFLYLIGFFIFMLAMGCNPWLSLVGSIAYSFVSYNFIIIEAGHLSKAFVMATMAPIMGGVILCYQKKYLWGILITLFFLGINIIHNHQQISYYLIIILSFIAIVYFIYAIKEKTLKDFFKSSAILIAIAVLAILPSSALLIPTIDYTKSSIRGGSVLTSNSKNEAESTGLDIDYAYAWSHGVKETMTLLIPNFYGGSSNYNIGNESETYKTLINSGQKRQFAQQFCKQAPTYWGNQPFTSGTVYGGAIICFLFIWGLFVVKRKEKWWLLAATIFSILLSWGNNFMWFNELMFKYLPLYNKFRAPSMALVIANIAMATLAILAIKEIVENKSLDKKNLIKQLYISGGITGGLCLIFALFGGSLSFSAISDSNYPDWLVAALQSDRKHLLTADSWRSFIYIALAFAGVFFYIRNKYNSNYLIFGLGILILFDLWTVDKRFLNNDDFVAKSKAKDIIATNADKQILSDKDPDYRVLNLTVSTFNDATTSRFHKSIGGYSGAKLRRYQDIIDYHFSKGINMNVANMLNTKYFIVPDKNQNNMPIVQRNYQSLGNAWFVDSIRWVNNPDEEIIALNNFDPAKTAIVDKVWKSNLPNSDQLTDTSSRSNNATIKLTDYKNPGYLIYESNNNKTQLAVFSEVYYKTWSAYIDGEKAPIVQVNYILRGLEIPKGQHKIEFKCVDEVFLTSAKISLWGSVLVGIVVIGLIGALVYNAYKKHKTIK